MRVPCERCGGDIDVDPALAGAAVRCPRCGQATLVPAEAGSIGAASAPPEPLPPQTAARAVMLPPAGVPVDERPANGLAVASLVLGVLAAVPLSCVGWLTGVPAIVCGVLALQRGESRGVAIAGIVTGALGTLLGIAGALLLALPFALESWP